MDRLLEIPELWDAYILPHASALDALVLAATCTALRPVVTDHMIRRARRRYHPPQVGSWLAVLNNPTPNLLLVAHDALTMDWVYSLYRHGVGNPALRQLVGITTYREAIFEDKWGMALQGLCHWSWDTTVPDSAVDEAMVWIRSWNMFPRGGDLGVLNNWQLEHACRRTCHAPVAKWPTCHCPAHILYHALRAAGLDAPEPKQPAPVQLEAWHAPIPAGHEAGDAEDMGAYDAAAHEAVLTPMELIARTERAIQALRAENPAAYADLTPQRLWQGTEDRIPMGPYHGMNPGGARAPAPEDPATAIGRAIVRMNPNPGYISLDNDNDPDSDNE